MVPFPNQFAVAMALTLSLLLFSEARGQRVKDDEKIEDLVRSGLAAGSAGDGEGRLAKLEAARDINPDAAAPRWHLGHVRVADAWKTIQEVEKSALTDTKLNAYLKQRAQYAGSVEGQARLAAWCQRNGLNDQSRAHWYQVLVHDPQGKHGKKALVALDAVWYRGTLLTKEQAEHQRRFDESAAREFDSLKPAMKTLRRDVVDGGEHALEIVIKELKKIRGDVAVVVITQVLLKPTDDADQTVALQIEATKLLGRLDSVEAVRILAWHAAQSRHERVRESARLELSRFPIHEYVPVLLAGMKMPIEVGVSARIQGKRTATTLSVSREGPAGRLYQDQLQAYQSIGGSPTLAIATGMTRNRQWSERPIIGF